MGYTVQIQVAYIMSWVIQRHFRAPAEVANRYLEAIPNSYNTRWKSNSKLGVATVPWC